MKWFTNLNIFWKVALILILAVGIFSINMLINVTAITKNRSELTLLRDKVYQQVELANENVILVQRVDELYTQAVSFADEDVVTNADNAFKVLTGNLEKLANIDTDSSSQLKAVLSNAQQYGKIAREVVTTMLAADADLSKVGDMSMAKADLYQKVTDAIRSYKKESDQLFKSKIEDANDRSSRSLWLTSVISLVLLTVMAGVTFFIAKSISNTAKQVADSLGELAQGKGDLNLVLTVSSTDELGQVAANFNAFLKLLRGAIQDVVNVTAPLLASSHDLIDKMEQASTATNKQSVDAETVQRSMEEMKVSASNISDSANSAAVAAQSAESETEQGMAVVKRTISISQQLNSEMEAAAKAINQLADDTESVGTILDVITSIAEQTNLLALNAAIEAARAGEQGRGFAVVADEVRTLASRTASATTEIRDVLTRLKGAAQSSVDKMRLAKEISVDNGKNAQATGNVLTTIGQQIGNINGMNGHIASATDEQTKVATLVVNNVSAMNASFSESLAALQQIRTISIQLSSFADNLKRATSQFRL